MQWNKLRFILIPETPKSRKGIDIIRNRYYSGKIQGITLDLLSKLSEIPSPTLIPFKDESHRKNTAHSILARRNLAKQIELQESMLSRINYIDENFLIFNKPADYSVISSKDRPSIVTGSRASSIRAKETIAPAFTSTGANKDINTCSFDATFDKFMDKECPKVDNFKPIISTGCLDRLMSGLILLCRTPAAVSRTRHFLHLRLELLDTQNFNYDGFMNEFSEKFIMRKYFAILAGLPLKRQGFIFSDKQENTSCTLYRLLDYNINKNVSFVELIPISGNNIREHALLLDCPILGESKFIKDAKAKANMDRILHAMSANNITTEITSKKNSTSILFCHLRELMIPKAWDNQYYHDRLVVATHSFPTHFNLALQDFFLHDTTSTKSSRVYGYLNKFP